MRWTLYNVRAVIDGQTILEPARITVEDGRILSVTEDAGELPECAVDGRGLTVTPGLIDVHIHGAAGRDLIEGSPKATAAVAENVVRDGVTGFLASLTVVSHKEMLKILDGYAHMQLRQGARLLGVHSEGPFLSKQYKALMDETHLREPSVEELDEMLEASGNRLRVMTVAPELAGMEAFIAQAAARGVKIMLGHTAATAQDVKRAARSGASGMTHLYNAMSQHLHREPGAVTGAFLEDSLFAELIADGFHVSPDVVAMTYKAMGPERMILITDAMLGKGMPDGDFIFSGLNCRKRGMEVEVIDNGRRAGSAVSLNYVLRRMQEMTGCSDCDLVQMACVNPARLLGMEKELGSLRPGLRADMALFDKAWNCQGTVMDGKWAFTREHCEKDFV